MKFNLFKCALLLFISLLLSSCQEKVPDLQAIATFFPNTRTLQKGLVNKYYYHNKANKSYDISTDIQYIKYQLSPENELIATQFNPGFEPTSTTKLLFEGQETKILEILNFYGNDTIKTEVNQSTLLSLVEDIDIHDRTRKYSWGELTFKDHQQKVRDTMVFNQPAKIFEGNRTRIVVSNEEGTSRTDTLKYQFVYAKNIGLYSLNYEDKNGRYWMELIEQILPKEFDQLANHGRHRIAYIDPTNTLDDNPNFKICNERIVDYYNHERGHQPILKGGKTAMFKILAEQLQVDKLFLESGYLTFRFVVNCEGAAGRFVTEQTDLDFQPKEFNPETVMHFYEIIKNIKDWRTTISRKESRDAYAYITFKLKDGEIIELLP